MKANFTIISENPIIVHINKNGRPIKETTAKMYAEKKFPHVTEWKFQKTDHSILATQIK
jgi:hypothetical protein